MSEAVSTERTRNYVQQIRGAVAYKAIAVIASFLVVPLMIRYLGQEQFGVWSTLLSLMSWVVFFDLGIGNGLRNKVATALAQNDRREAASYIASSYSLMGLISLILWLLITACSFFIPWQTVFNTSAIAETALRAAVQLAAFFIVLNFWIGLIGALLGAVQKTSLTALGQLIANALALSFVYLLTNISSSSISYMAIAYGTALVTANVVLSVWFYSRYPELRPKVRLDKHHIQPLLSVGLQFFSIQLAVLVIFATDKILITQLFGPQNVAQYEVVFKLFSVITLMHTLITAPLWSAYTDAYHRKDLAWVRHMLRKQLAVFGGIVVAICGMGIAAKPAIAIWVGGELEVPEPLVAATGLFVAILTWNNVYAMFINGTGQLQVQLYTAGAGMLLNIPLALFLTKYLGFGPSGVVLATCGSLLFSAVALPIQSYSLVAIDARAGK